MLAQTLAVSRLSLSAARAFSVSSASNGLFAHVEQAPRDPILGITEKFLADPNSSKINLGVGAYRCAHVVHAVMLPLF
jgi:hypothetical protein